MAKGSDKYRVYKHNSVLDHALTAAFLVECALIVSNIDFESKQILGACFAATAVVIHVSKWTLAAIFGWVSRNVLGKAPFNDPLSRGPNMDKFCDQGWQLLIHVSMSIFERWINAEENWMDNLDRVWTPPLEEQRPSAFFRLFYLSQLGVWMFTAFSHRFLESRKKDYYVMYIHHVATIALVGWSFVGNTLRIGLLVLMVHDISDIPIDLLKMVNLLSLESFHGFFLSEIIFVINLCTWAYFRLYRFLFHVIYCSLVVAHNLNFKRISDKATGDFLTDFWQDPFLENVPGYFACNCLLTLLWFLHCWWFYLLLRIAYRLFSKTTAHEIAREEYEGASESDKDTGDASSSAPKAKEE